MSKIYNEIVIDMNPESSTFEETLYEDSFEHEGDMMLMQGVHEGEKIIVGNPISGDDKSSFMYQTYVYSGNQWVKSDTISWNDWQSAGGYEGEIKHFETLNQAPSYIEKEETQWGAPNITKDMLINPDGTPRSIQEIYATLDPILTGITGEDLVNYINDLLPQYQAVPEEEKEFLVKERGFEERGLETKKEADIYGLQPEVGGAITPTTGAGMRGQIAGKAGIKKGFESAYEGYGLGMEEAAFTEEKGLYGLEKTAGQAYETDVVGAIGTGIETPFAKPGEGALVDPNYFFAKEGGRVPSKGETFLDFLTQLPDAGGT